MIVDSSALLAVIFEEDEAFEFRRLMKEAKSVKVSSVSVVEAGVGSRWRFGANGLAKLQALLQELAIELVPFTAEDAIAALEADRRFGKGAHQARLNFGDCCAYALAARMAAPILHKGGDFAHTDLEAVR